MSDMDPDRWPIASVLNSEDLSRRTHRPPDYETENRALAILHETMANTPEMLFQRLVDCALELCGADSAGICFLQTSKGEERFRWQAVAGRLAQSVGVDVPSVGNICRMVLDRDIPMVFAHPEPQLRFAPHADLPIAEILLIPVHGSRKPIGTIWVAIHEAKRQFDLEDRRQLWSLSRVAAASLRITSVASPRINDAIQSGQDSEVAHSDPLTEQALRESQAKLRAAMESMTDAVFISDADGRFVDFNQAFVTFHRFRHRNEVPLALGDYPDVIELSSPDGTATPLEMWAVPRALRGETAMEEEYHLRRRDTGESWIGSYNFAPIRDMDGNIAGSVVVARDITAKKEIERELFDRSARLQAILETATDAILSIDETGAITSVNPATERMFGYSQSELIGQNIKMLMPDPFREEHDGYLRRYTSTGERRIIGRSREASARRRDGTIFPVELSVAEIDQERKFTGFIRDVTQRKKLQRHLLNIVAEEQQRISLELHDGIQQELTGLSLFAGVLLQTSRDLALALESSGRASSLPDSENAWDALRLLQDAADRLTHGLADTHRHVQELAHGIMPVAIDAEGLRNALDSLARGVGPSIACHFHSSGDVSIEDNNTASHVYRIAQEALNNAIRHGKATWVHIALRDADGKFVLEIEDNGSGFDPFTTTHGMGLRTMEYRASLIGGILQLERAPKQGMIVRCIFPRHLGPTNYDLLSDPFKPVTGRSGGTSP